MDGGDGDGKRERESRKKEASGQTSRQMTSQRQLRE